MPELSFNVGDVEMDEASGALRLRIKLVNAVAGEQVHSVALNVQVHIEPARRRYNENEKRALEDLFGEPSRWATTVRPVYWTTKKVGVGTFIGENELEVRCEVEPAAAATKYIRALEDGDVPVTLLFSGRVLYMSGEGLQMAPIPWAKETTYRIPVSSFRNLIGQGAPAGGTTWI